jgi:hypothetical protein
MTILRLFQAVSEGNQRLLLNETFPTRMLVAFASGLAAVVLWKAFKV